MTSIKPNNEWEKEFDEKFQLIDDLDWDRDLQEEVKKFIHFLLASERQRLKGIIKSRIVKDKKGNEIENYSHPNLAIKEILKLLE